MKKPKRGEIIAYVEGGILQDILRADPKLPREKWKPIPFTLIDFDIDGADELCEGCPYSPDPHYNNCGNGKAVEPEGK